MTLFGHSYPVFFKKLLKYPTNHPIVQLFRYGMVVVIAFPIDFGLLYIFTDKFHMFYVLSAILSFTISMAVNFALSVWWVFTKRTARALWHEAALFGMIGFIGLGLTAFLVWFLTAGVGLHYLVSKLVAVTVVFFWSFGARRFIFQKQFKELLPKKADA